jgi:beta-phosphoglucomutase-like phosphatase (HAD superfamily)
VGSAVAAGMPVVLIPGTEFPPDPAVREQADLVLDSIKELDPDAIERLGS